MRPPKPDLVLEGRVEAISTMARAGHSARWRVRVAVERVVEGEFGGPIFEFAVHSPVKSGVREGQAIRVSAKRAGDGYVVDPLQWLPSR